MSIELYLWLPMFHSYTLEVTGFGVIFFFFGHDIRHSLTISVSLEKEIV